MKLSPFKAKISVASGAIIAWSPRPGIVSSDPIALLAIDTPAQSAFPPPRLTDSSISGLSPAPCAAGSRRELSSEERRHLGYGTVQRNRGWGLTLGVVVPDFEACLKRVKRVPDALLAADEDARTMLVREPAGYLLEVSASE